MSYASRRTGPSSSTPSAAQRKAATERNQLILRTLLKEPANKFCADCKTSGHPRWASWSLGIFVCIRCSGIHRSMGTHISKVRSIDLDTWSDEQVEPLVKWGNRRANLYWEAKLPDKYVPDDSKIENFIRTKYEMKRWTLSPTIPDPALLDKGIDAEERVPLAEVQKRAAATVVRNEAVNHHHIPQPHLHQQQPRQKPPPKHVPDLLDDDFLSQKSPPTTATQYANVSSSGRISSAQSQPASTPQRYHRTTESPQSKPRPHKQQPQSSSLLGLDFGPAPISSKPSNHHQHHSHSSSTQFHQQQQQPPPPAPKPNGRPDLKKSILSLYATPSTPSYQTPPPPQQPFAQKPDPLAGFSNLSLNPGSNNRPSNSTPSSSGGNNLNDLLGLGGSFSSPAPPVQPQPQAQPLKQQPAPKPKSAFDDLISGGSSAWASVKPQTSSAASSAPAVPPKISLQGSYSSSSTNNGSAFTNNYTPKPAASTTSSFNTFASNTNSVQNDDWADFTSASSEAIPPRSSGTQAAAAFNSTSPTNPMDEDLFANVWK